MIFYLLYSTKGVEMMVQFDVKRVQKGTESFMVSFDFTKTPVTQVADYIIHPY